MRRPRAVSRKKKASGKNSGEKAQPNDPLLARLKAWRAGQARAQSVPPYVVFHDSTLSAIAAAQPRDLDALSTIAGIGAKKLERYGPALLELIGDTIA